MVIKSLNNSYIDEIIELHKKSIVPIWKRAGREYNYREIKEYILMTLKNGKILGYLDANQLIGCGGITLDKKHQVGEIHLLLIDPKFQGKGIGTSIMKTMEDYAKEKVKKLRLNVLIKNPAVKFYEKR